MTEQVHRVMDQQQVEGWAIVQAMIILVLKTRVRIGEVEMEGDFKAVQLMAGEPVLVSGMALVIILVEISLMYLKKH
ncbi:MAG: hypothetical protein QNK35_16350 [Bacteroides sp.]|nr:hypothetical protein [Bacteroides sp.]